MSIRYCKKDAHPFKLNTTFSPKLTCKHKQTKMLLKPPSSIHYFLVDPTYLREIRTDLAFSLTTISTLKLRLSIRQEQEQRTSIRQHSNETDLIFI